MGDSIELEDGKLWGGASWLVRSALTKIASHIDQDPKFSAWLEDCSNRSNGMVGFDLRGLSKERINLFYQAAEIALEETIHKGSKNWDSEEIFQSYIESLKLLTQRKGSPYYSGTTEWDGKKIDVEDLWET